MQFQITALHHTLWGESADFFDDNGRRHHVSFSHDDGTATVPAHVPALIQRQDPDGIHYGIAPIEGSEDVPEPEPEVAAAAESVPVAQRRVPRK